MESGMKRCSICGINKELAEFSKDKRLKSGLRSYCRKCASLYFKNWWNNRTKEQIEYRHEKQKICRLEAKRTGKKALWDKRYAKTHREICNKLNRSYYKRNSEKIRSKRKDWQKGRVSTLSDSWIKILIQLKLPIPGNEIPHNLIEAKREQMLAHRAYLKIRKEINDEERIYGSIRG
jgi:ribosomal protein S27AE